MQNSKYKKPRHCDDLASSEGRSNLFREVSSKSESSLAVLRLWYGQPAHISRLISS